MIKILFDDTVAQREEIVQLSEEIQRIVSQVTGIEDVFVYGNSSDVKIKIAPIEIFVEMSASKITDENALVQQIKEKLSQWKQSAQFPHPINLTLIPMNWKVEIGI